MNSALSCSSRSVVSATVWLTRAEACSTLRLKSVMKLLAMMRENPYANGAAYYFAPGAAGQWRGIRKRNGVVRRHLPARTKSNPQQTRRPRLLYTTSIVFKTLYTDRRWKREQSHEDPFKHPGD